MKKPTQPWIDYLFTCMDADPSIAPYVWEFKHLADMAKKQTVKEDDIRVQLQNLKKLILPTCKYQHVAEKVIDGTIQFIFKQNE